MSFAVVLFADGKSHIFNTNCRNISLLKSLKQSCNEVCRETDQIDLADETGECKYLFRSLQSYASDVIAPRQKLVLLRVEEASHDDKQQGGFRFTPLLKGVAEDKDYMNILNPAQRKTTPKGGRPTLRKVSLNLANYLAPANKTVVQANLAGLSKNTLVVPGSNTGGNRVSFTTGNVSVSYSNTSATATPATTARKDQRRGSIVAEK